MNVNRVAASAFVAAFVFNAVHASASDRIPLTTSSAEAKQLYLEGRDLAEKLRATDAKVRFEKAVEKDPSFALAHIGLANSSGTAKEFFAEVDRANALADKVSEPEKLFICAIDAGAKGEPDRQKDCLTRLIAAVPDDERAHNQLAAFHFGRQDYAAAIDAYKKATSINPKFSQPYNQMGYAYRFMGRNAEAEQAFKTYIALIPNDPNPYDSYAELLMKLGRFDESIRMYQKALAIDPNFVASYIGIGNNRVLMGRGDLARASYGRLAAIARNDGEKQQAHFWTAMSYIHEGDANRALAEIEANAAIASARGDLVGVAGQYNLMANVLLEAGRTDEAAAKFAEQIATIDKAEVAQQVKDAAHRQQLFDEARVALARNDGATAKAKSAAYATAVAEKKIPFEVLQTHEIAGRIAIFEKDNKAAVAELRQANQQDPRVLYMLAVALDRSGDTRSAKTTAAQAADWNALSNTYGYVRGKARAIATSTKRS
jgi:tetratricopeptide (TPR) repeat protein